MVPKFRAYQIEKRYEMNKQEVIEKLKGHGAWCTECHDINGEKDRYVKVAKVRELLEQLDEPQKVTVPEEFDEWFLQIKQKWCKAAEQFALWKICQFGFGHYFEDVSHERTPLDLSVWVSNHQDEAVHAILNGYEVEEELKYEVIFPNLTGEKDLYLMKFYEKLSITSDRNFYVDQRYIFTEKEIKAIDERYWAFAVPVDGSVEEALKRKILIHDQHVVLDWLKEVNKITTRPTPFGTIYSVINSYEAFIRAKLSKEEQFQVLAAFAEWGMKNDQED